MISPTTVLLALFALGVWAVVDLLVAGGGIWSSIRRWLRRKRGDLVEIPIPPDLAVAVANGLITVGSELVVADRAEREGSRVVVHAVSPRELAAPLGTRVEVRRIRARKLSLKLPG